MRQHITFFVLNFVIPLSLALGFMSLSLPVRTYTLEIATGIPIFGYLLFIFIIYYATPAYLIVFLIKKASDFFKFDGISKSLESGYAITSIPIGMLAFGFAFLYMKLRDVKKIDTARTVASNLISIVLIAALQARMFMDALTIIAFASVVFFFTGSTIDSMRKIDGQKKSG